MASLQGKMRKTLADVHYYGKLMDEAWLGWREVRICEGVEYWNDKSVFLVCMCLHACRVGQNRNYEPLRLDI
jgi:hypothetical protein